MQQQAKVRARKPKREMCKSIHPTLDVQCWSVRHPDRPDNHWAMVKSDSGKPIQVKWRERGTSE